MPPSASRIRLSDLPAPSGCHGWPWDQESPVPSDVASLQWPSISIVMPSYNQACYLEAAIRSVLLQNYPALELFVIDGGSQDGSVDVIRRYEPWLNGWVSEKDGGQSDAINKGLRRASGKLFNWLNSDDRLCAGALYQVGRRWIETGADLIVGACDVVEVESRKSLHRFEPKPPTNVQSFFSSGGIVLAQCSTFLPTALVREQGGIRQDLHMVMDWELYLRLTFARGMQLRTAAISNVLSELSEHPATKTQQHSERFRREAIAVLHELEPKLPEADQRALRSWRHVLETQEAVVQALAAPQKLRGRLWKLAIKNPFMLTSRFFWGAVRRAL